MNGASCDKSSSGDTVPFISLAGSHGSDEEQILETKPPKWRANGQEAHEVVGLLPGTPSQGDPQANTIGWKGSLTKNPHADVSTSAKAHAHLVESHQGQGKASTIPARPIPNQREAGKTLLATICSCRLRTL
jgi:hypothetical protein